MKMIVAILTIAMLYFISCSKNESNPVDTSVPLLPTLSSPSDNGTSISLPPSLIWNASSGATSYTLQVSINNGFTSFLFNQSGLTVTNQSVTGLNNSTKYYWRVSASNSNGTSVWSTIRNFTTVSGSLSGQPCPGSPTVVYGGKTYNTVMIGSQCWFKENLDIGTMVQGNLEQSNNGVLEKYCYDNNISNCNTYGGLYQWNEAMQYVTSSGAKGICPTGWHIPTNDEFNDTLILSVKDDGNALKQIGQGIGAGAGTNTSGFSGLLSGDRDGSGSFNNMGKNANFWSSSELNSGSAGYLGLSPSGNNITLNYYYRYYGFSVRCVKD